MTDDQRSDIAFDGTAAAAAAADLPAARKPKHHRPKARAHGEGSVCFEGATGKWVAVVDLGFVDGKRKRKKRRYSSQQEARRALTSLTKLRDDGVKIGSDRITVKAWLEKWIAECVEGQTSKLSASTRRSYADAVRLHIVPLLGHVPLTRLSPDDVRAFIKSKLEEKDDDDNAALSTTSVRYFHGVLRAALHEAESREYITRNVASKVTAPPRRKKEAQALTTMQAGKLLAALDGDRLRALFSVAVAMGLRRGEIVGLRWDNVDIDAGVIRVREQLQRVPHRRNEKKEIVERRGLEVQGLKTDKSRRTLKIPAVVLDELRAHKKRQDLEREAAAPHGLWTETGYVFTTRTGAPLDGRNVHRRWKDALEAAGLPAVPFHASRHTSASFLLAQGASLYDVKENHGHSQIALTADTYAHLLDELRDKSAARSDAAMRAAIESAREKP